MCMVQRSALHKAQLRTKLSTLQRKNDSCLGSAGRALKSSRQARLKVLGILKYNAVSLCLGVSKVGGSRVCFQSFPTGVASFISQQKTVAFRVKGRPA